MKKLFLYLILVVLMINLASALQVSYDDFESDSFSGGLGWTGAWDYSNDCVITNLSNPIGNYQMRGDVCDVIRYVDSSYYQNVQVSFYATATSLEDGDYCYYYYFDGTSYSELLTLINGDDDGVLDYYSFNVTANSNSGVRMFAPNNGDYCYLDNVQVTGDILAPELNVYSDLNYQKDKLISVDLTSSVSSVMHYFDVYDSNDILICSQSTPSPVIPETIFTGTCQLPDVEQNNAYITFSTPGANITKTFNIVGGINNPDELSIEQVYFSSQVLQGGNTEIFAILDSFVSADYFYEPMNFEPNSPINHNFEINLNGIINVTIPSGFTLISGTTSGINNVSFILQSPNISEEKIHTGIIYLNSTVYDNFYLISISDSKIVDSKVEVGHGDFNYIDFNSDIGTDNSLLFNLIRVWGIGSDILNEPATDVRFSCDFPMILPNTVDSKYTTTYNIDNITAEGLLTRLEGISMFRIFVLSQEVNMASGDNYEVICTDLQYNFTHTNIIANIPGINLSIRSLEPLIIDMDNNSGYVTYTILNNESYDLKDLEFLWTIGTHTTRAELDSLDSGEFIQYNILTNSSGEIDFKARFIPEWMFNSRSPIAYTQTEFDIYNTPDFLDGLNTDDYYTNQSALNTPVLETQVMDFSITILRDSPFGGAYKINYLFYDSNGLLAESIDRQIIGVNDHTISFSSLELIPEGIEEDYDVYTIVSILDENGDWYNWPETFIGIQTIAALTDNGPIQQVGLYDVIVTNRYDRYEVDDKITADILIKNTGDTPDEDTVLLYYLIGPDGQRFGETREQILEVPVGSTILTRSITLPLNSNIGEWEFHATYETIVQDTIQVYDSFEVVTGMTVLEKGLRINTHSNYLWIILWIIIILIFISIYYHRKTKKHYN